MLSVSVSVSVCVCVCVCVCGWVVCPLGPSGAVTISVLKIERTVLGGGAWWCPERICLPPLAHTVNAPTMLGPRACFERLPCASYAQALNILRK